jgi:hypothetical protein
VAIANSTRFHPHLPKYPPLIPPWKLVQDSKSGRIPHELFDREYLAQLRALDPRRVLADLEAFGPEVILLCWESPGARCHRRLAAGWLETELGIVVPEMAATLW